METFILNKVYNIRTVSGKDITAEFTKREDTGALTFHTGLPHTGMNEVLLWSNEIQAARLKHTTTNSGSNGNYYSVPVTKPLSEDQPAYIAECNDIIEALDMNFAEGNGFKALWRKAAARQGNGKNGNSPLYDAQKVLWSGERLVSQET